MRPHNNNTYRGTDCVDQHVIGGHKRLALPKLVLDLGAQRDALVVREDGFAARLVVVCCVCVCNMGLIVAVKDL